MKRLFSIVLIAASITAIAQPKKGPKMAPVLEDGYYVTAKNDTVRGKVQTNPADETELYTKFFYQKPGTVKVAAVDGKKAKAYGFGDRHFIALPSEGNIYIERLAEGRLNFFEYRFNGKVDGYPGVESQFYAQDTRAEGADAGLKDINKISTKFYKRDLKPYMKDQLMIWTDLDKFTFNKQAVINAINEYNRFYTVTAD